MNRQKYMLNNKNKGENKKSKIEDSLSPTGSLGEGEAQELRDVSEEERYIMDTSDRYIKLLDFRHFVRFYRFDKGGCNPYRKQVSDGVNVSVVIDVVTRNGMEISKT